MGKDFAEIQFESDEDALAAIENMDGSQVFGQTLKVRRAKKETASLDSTTPGKSITSTADINTNPISLEPGILFTKYRITKFFFLSKFLEATLFSSSKLPCLLSRASHHPAFPAKRS
ncbi:hypothetical protein TRICI_004640 [Trichomonascus ciferrii]|uniref:RRM domain-containing protein n=1 Tax=Trichomonascus ciferrii TaxID=44093 RepID=A0A642V013_9ASCO|nr:hypothetical protein TRICI_004640 [Trichomonascus ciferrii]